MCWKDFRFCSIDTPILERNITWQHFLSPQHWLHLYNLMWSSPTVLLHRHNVQFGLEIIRGFTFNWMCVFELWACSVWSWSGLSCWNIFCLPGESGVYQNNRYASFLNDFDHKYIHNTKVLVPFSLCNDKLLSAIISNSWTPPVFVVYSSDDSSAFCPEPYTFQAFPSISYVPLC